MKIQMQSGRVAAIDAISPVEIASLIKDDRMPVDLPWMEHHARSLLRDVSRSFYLSLRALPPPVRGTLSLAYLLARAADTFADSGTLGIPQRLEALDATQAALASEEGALRMIDCGLAVVEDTEHGLSSGEATLMHRLGELLAWYWAVPDVERALVRQALETIISGQRADVTRTEIATAEELDLYTYQVAGCVGEFWTRLSALKMPSFAKAPIEELIERGIRFGQGLQLINVLRDVSKDAAIGRSYLPGVPATARPEEKWAAAQPWITRCREHLDQGRLYTAGVRGVRSRFVKWLPLRLAEETLTLIIAAGPAAMAVPVKVPRRRVRSIAIGAWMRALRA